MSIRPVTDVVTLDTVVARNDALLAAAVGQDLVMLHAERNAYYDTGAIGGEIWRRIAGPCRVKDLCEGLLERYDVDRDTCESEVVAFLNDAYRHDVIRIV
jgi:hypothetical protein